MEVVVGVAGEAQAYEPPPPPTAACLPEAERARIQAEADANARRLGLDKRPLRPLTGRMIAPMRASADSPLRHHWAISNFVDHDRTAHGNQYGDGNRDYTCGDRTYDLDNGYNHAGTDYFTWPFRFWQMDRDYAEVVAVAPGVITYRADGNDDRHCGSFPSNVQWNAVYVRHADGTQALYGHLKAGSLTSKPVGAAVAAGEVLGQVGSSGFSTGPHLHLELLDARGRVIDPYAGPCNPTAEAS